MNNSGAEETADGNSSAVFIASDVSNGSDPLDPRMENLSNWQRLGIEAISTTGRKCLTDFWTESFPQGKPRLKRSLFMAIVIRLVNDLCIFIVVLI